MATDMSSLLVGDGIDQRSLRTFLIVLGRRR